MSGPRGRAARRCRPGHEHRLTRPNVRAVSLVRLESSSSSPGKSLGAEFCVGTLPSAGGYCGGDVAGERGASTEATDALNRGDLDAWLAFLSPSVVWETLRDVPGQREVYHGRTEVREWVEELFDLTERGIQTEIEQITDLGDDRVFMAAVATARGKSNAMPFELHTWMVVSFAEGLVTRRQVFWTRDQALEAAGLSE